MFPDRYIVFHGTTQWVANHWFVDNEFVVDRNKQGCAFIQAEHDEDRFRCKAGTAGEQILLFAAFLLPVRDITRSTTPYPSETSGSRSILAVGVTPTPVVTGNVRSNPENGSTRTRHNSDFMNMSFHNTAARARWTVRQRRCIYLLL